MLQRKQSVSLRTIAGLLFLSSALFAALLLWAVNGVYKETAQLTAARDVIKRGRILAHKLSGHPSLQHRPGTARDWHAFGKLVDYLQAIEPTLQFVSVLRDDVVMFEKQARSFHSSADRDPTGATAENDYRKISVRSRVIGQEQLPVMLFGADIDATESDAVRLEVALLRDAVGRRADPQAQAAEAMFNVALITIGVSFGVCSMFIIWLMRRETRRERMIRAEEHLAFSGVLANGIAHDFRNPMSSLKLDVQLLNKESARGHEMRTQRISELTDRISGTIDRMDKVFREFLYLSKPEKLTTEAVDLKMCIKECVDMLTPRFDHSGLHPEMEFPDSALRVFANEESLRRAIVNVLINAIQFSPRNSTIEIVLLKKRSLAVLEILDRGIGIERSKLKQVFDMFVTSRPEGTGLGLFLARTAVERFGGKIAAETRQGGGTRIHIALPLAPPLEDT